MSMVELGEEPLKFRRILQNLVLAASFYPGKEGTALSGYYVRAGAGMGWAGTGAKKAEQDEPQHKGNRIDEWGTGVFFETGYEFWVAPDATVGLSFVLNGFSINETIVDTLGGKRSDQTARPAFQRQFSDDHHRDFRAT